MRISAFPSEADTKFRISATDWLEESLPNEPSWTSEDTTRLAPILYEHGVDLLDVSSGGNHPKQKIYPGPAYQSPFARDVMKAIGAKGAYPAPSSTSTRLALSQLLMPLARIRRRR